MNPNAKDSVKTVSPKTYDELMASHSADFALYRKRWNYHYTNMIPSPGPIHLDLELINGCNYSCSFCPYSFKKTDRPEGFDSQGEKQMPFALIEKIAKEGEELNAKAVEFGYNTEPLLRKDIKQIIQCFRSHGFCDLRLGSNGSLLTQEMAENLIQSGLTQIQVSLDAHSEDTYKISRNSQKYNEVVSNVLTLIKIKEKTRSKTPVVRVTFVEHELNRHETQNFINYWKTKADLISVQKLVSYKNTPDYLKKQASKNITEKKYECYMPLMQLSIKSDGKVHPCCTVPGMNIDIGNAKNQHLRDIWNSKLNLYLQKIHANKKGDSFKICKDCLDETDE